MMKAGQGVVVSRCIAVLTFAGKAELYQETVQSPNRATLGRCRIAPLLQ